MIRIFFDGGTALNSVCFVDAAAQEIVVKRFNNKMTNNELEYTALIEAMQYCIDKYGLLHDFTFCGDSEVIVKHMKGEYNVSAVNLKPLFKHAGFLCNLVIKDKVVVNCDCDFMWVPRAENLAGVHLEKLLHG